MTEILSPGACENCKGKKYHDRLSGVGSSVQTDEGMAGTTHYSFLQCSDCGSILARYEDRGFGKEGPFFKLLTESLF